MPEELGLSYAVAMVLQSIALGHVYGYRVMVVTGLPSGTVYPALGRLERDGLILSRWEKQAKAEAAQRPPRKYYKVARGKRNVTDGERTIPLLAKFAIAAEEEHV